MRGKRKANNEENSFLVIVIMLIVVFGPVTLAHALALVTQ